MVTNSASPGRCDDVNPQMPMSSAADLKFLHRLRQTHFRNFKSKSGARIIYLLVPLLLPKFVSEGAAMYHELRKRGTGRRRSLLIGSTRGERDLKMSPERGSGLFPV